MATSPDSDARSEEKGPTSPAGRGRATVVFMAVVAVLSVAIPILLLVSYNGHPMSQVKVMSVSMCSYVFAFLLCIYRDRSLLTEFVRLSYVPLLAFSLAPAIGSATTTFVLFFSTVWAAGNLGYSLAVHRLLKGIEPGVHMVPGPSFSIEDSVKGLNFGICIGAPVAVLVWTLFMGIVIYVQPLNELDILFFLSYSGWIHAALWVILVAQLPVHGVLLTEQLQWFLPALLPWMLLSPVISFISHILWGLCQLLLMMALVAFVWYNLAIYIHFLEIATLSTTTQGNEDNQEDNSSKKKSD